MPVAAADAFLPDLDGDDVGNIFRREGESIYARKPNKRAEDVTWLQAEYAHADLRGVRFKSVQRFAETWAALERTYAMSGLDEDGAAEKSGGSSG